MKTGGMKSYQLGRICNCPNTYPWGLSGQRTYLSNIGEVFWILGFPTNVYLRVWEEAKTTKVSPEHTAHGIQRAHNKLI
jgi:hypothetical protein